MPLIARLLCVLLALAACQRDAASSRKTETTAAKPVEANGERRSPLSQSERRTTAGEIAMRNLQGEISALEHEIAAGSGSVKSLAALSDLLVARAVCQGRLSDYEKVRQLGEEAVRIAPADQGAYILRARARAALHDFAGALADVEEAERRGAARAEVEGLRAEALQELGRSDEALEIRQRLAAKRGDLFTLAAEAVLRAARGDVETAEKLFVDAQYAYRDVSPFPFAWLYFCQGWMWERAGKAERARELYRAALERLPGYAPATAHLAALEAADGRRREAIALLRPLVESSDDPEYAGQLSALLREEGQVPEADSLRASAAARFDELVAKYPAAFAAKAARFWMGPGGDAEKAVRLAELNLSARQTPEDQKLLADARAALGTR